MTTRLQVTPTMQAQARALLNPDDTWMTPTTDATPSARQDYGEWCDEEHLGWEETDHWHVFYHTRLRDIVDDAMADQHIAATGDGSGALDAYLELREEFWEAWDTYHDAHTHWQTNIAHTHPHPTEFPTP